MDGVNKVLNRVNRDLIAEYTAKNKVRRYIKLNNKLRCSLGPNIPGESGRRGPYREQIAENALPIPFQGGARQGAPRQGDAKGAGEGKIHPLAEEG